LLRRNRDDEAGPLLRECLKIRQERLPDDWNCFHTQNLLGGSLLGQEKYVEAEPLLLSGYEEGGKSERREFPLLPGRACRRLANQSFSSTN
jgi:hypothetical protein